LKRQVAILWHYGRNHGGQEAVANVTMATLDLSPAYIARLVFKARGVQSREGLTDPQPGSNPTDDKSIDALQDASSDLSRRELEQEIRGLASGERDELVALFWIGRGDYEPDDWATAVRTAAQRREIPSERYLLGHPLVGDYWADGLQRLGIEMPIEDEEEIASAFDRVPETRQ
jgi:hypothetical protein